MADEKDIESIRFIDSAGGTLRSSVYPTATCTVPQGALQNELNFIPVSIQVRVNMVNGCRVPKCPTALNVRQILLFSKSVILGT